MFDSALYQKLLGVNIKAARVATGWGLQEATRRSQGRFTYGVLGSYERGQRQMSAAALAAVAELYDMAIADLLPVLPPAIPRPRVSAEQLRADDGFEHAGPDSELVGVLDLDRTADHWFTGDSPVGRWCRTVPASVATAVGHAGTLIDHATLRRLALAQSMPVEVLWGRLIRYGLLDPAPGTTAAPLGEAATGAAAAAGDLR